LRLKSNGGNRKENAFSCFANFSLIGLKAVTDALRFLSAFNPVL